MKAVSYTHLAQMGFGLPSIGGKDSMSGTFNDIDVPPTLVSFAVDVAKIQDVITPRRAAKGWLHLLGSSVIRRKYSWKVKRIFL